MQLLNKGYIIKAAHSTRCTIAVLGRGMDYSDNKRGGSRGGEVSSAQSETDWEKQHEGKWRHRQQWTSHFNALFENLKVRIRFHKTRALCAITLQQYLFKKLSILHTLSLSLSLSLSVSLCGSCTLWLSRVIPSKCNSDHFHFWLWRLTWAKIYFCAPGLITRFILLELDDNYLFEMTATSN